MRLVTEQFDVRVTLIALTTMLPSLIFRMVLFPYVCSKGQSAAFPETNCCIHCVRGLKSIEEHIYVALILEQGSFDTNDLIPSK